MLYNNLLLTSAKQFDLLFCFSMSTVLCAASLPVFKEYFVHAFYRLSLHSFRKSKAGSFHFLEQ
jgi:hypothetical protein